MNLKLAEIAKIRLLIEEDPDGVLRVFYDKQDAPLVRRITRGRECVMRPVPPFVRFTSPLPTLTRIPFSAYEKSRPFWHEVRQKTIGKVTFFGDCKASGILAFKVQKARDPDLSMLDEIKAVEKAAGSMYYVSIARDRTYLYYKGD